MSSDGENAKNPTSEVDEKPNLDSTDSSQDSSQDAVKSENEDNQEKKSDADSKPTEKTPEVEKKDEKPEVLEKVNDEKKEVVNNETNDDSKKVKDEKKKEDKEEKTDEDSEGGDASEDGDGEDDDKKEVPLLDQPLEQSGPRERKKVQRFNEDFVADQKETTTKIDIAEGEGVQLGDIPRIDASISRFKNEDLKLLHRVLFKIPGKTIQIKKNIRKFSGFEFNKDSDSYSKKLQSIQKMEMKQLKIICEMLDLDKKGNRDEIGERICEFLMEPKDSGKPAGGGRPKRTAAVRANNRGYSSLEDDDSSDGGRKSRATRGKGRRANLKDETSSDDDAEFNPSDSEEEEEKPRVTKRGRGRGPGRRKLEQDSEEEEEVSELEETPSSDDSEEPKSKKRRGPVPKQVNNRAKKSSPKNSKSPVKKNTPSPNKKKAEPAKRGRKPAKHESEDDEKESEENNAASSSEDEPLVKKSSPQPPTDEEIKTYVKEILEGANLEEITMKTVCKQVYAHYPDFDLAHKKDFIKTTVKSLIST